MMNLAILFWFYKEPDVCENRLQLVKKYNPSLKIYGLFGGEPRKAAAYRKRLEKYLDDLYIFDRKASADWKWINGDLMILDWYDKRGRDLKWDSVAVIQWDTLVFDSLRDQFAGIQKGQIYLSGLRDLDKKIENKWDWTKPGGKERQKYLNFLDYVKTNYGYADDPPPCSLFILQVFPRIFFEKYLTVKDKETGMLEYKVPIYARIFGVPFYEKILGVRWNGGLKPLNAIPEEIPERYIKAELLKKDGWRIFHPYYKIWRSNK